MQKQKEILNKKGQDYASDNTLSNFILAGSICKLTPEQNCLSLMATKMARLGELMSSGKAPNFESVRDTIIDLANYCILLDMLLTDAVIGYPKFNDAREPSVEINGILYDKGTDPFKTTKGCV